MTTNRMPSRLCRRTRKGYLLLEVVLAMAVFSLAATGFTLALQKCRMFHRIVKFIAVDHRQGLLHRQECHRLLQESEC